ncbi:MAG: glycosyltransferase [Desulfobacteraceae bacterium]|nr:glycosyltransferase [Desulfobacteraceae bacterium]
MNQEVQEGREEKGQMTPCFSVVIPVLNNADRLGKVLAALEDQDYPADCYEVIVVDNGSDDGSEEVAESFANTVCLQEHKRRNSPYSARNRGIEAAKFEIVAFLDATCVPDRRWLKMAAESFVRNNADLVTGAIFFELSSRPETGEIYDALFNLNTKAAYKKKWAPCANLFIKRRLFYKYGMFEEGARSGEDQRLTRVLTAAGCVLVYNEDAKVYKPARNSREVIYKQKRVARGQVGIWRKENRVCSYLGKALFRALVPPCPVSVYRAIRDRGRPWMYKKFVGIYLFRYYILIIMTMENIKTMIREK